MGAFSLTYAIFLIIAGKLIDRFNVNWLYAAAFLLWSAATGATGLANGFWSILMLRFLLGASESIAYPAYSKMICTSFPEKLRGAANGLIDAGSKLGPAIGLSLGEVMLGRYTWRGMFAIMGAASLLWLIPWCAIAGKLPGSTKHRAQSPQAASFRQLVSKRELWGTAIGLFGGNYAWFFLLNWLPYYFETERHYSHARIASEGSLPFYAIAASSTFFGFLADYFIHRGYEAGRVRQLFVCFGITGCCVLMFATVSVKSESLSNILLILAFISLGVWSSNHWALSQFLAGTATAGKWTGLQNCVGNFAGVLGPWVSGYAFGLTHSFYSAFAIASGFLLMAVLSYWFIVGKPHQVFEQPVKVEKLVGELQH
jgi:MFS family permease